MELLPLGLRPLRTEPELREWTAERLQEFVGSAGLGQVIVVSCREPYSHEHRPGGVAVTTPASGLVTALEPVVRACQGTWIAHASGTADANFVDADGVCPVPPDSPDYSLRRVWLTSGERQGFLEGFANEGLWPLCHRIPVAPVFRPSDWRAYVHANQRFADAVLSAATGPDPLVLVQDYHFALLPEMVRARLPNATVVTFWHIPWPDQNRLLACPWWPALVAGLMGSSIVGFQTAQDEGKFAAATDTLRRLRHRASVAPAAPAREALAATYPISVSWPTAAEQREWPSGDACREQVLREAGLPAHVQLIVGVDRFDYTKGLLEKALAMELLLERDPTWQGAVCLLQVAAPTRSTLPAYAAYRAQVRAEVARINTRFASGGVPAIILREAHHDRHAVYRLYRAASVCAVTSLHDGMNLVSKEFVSARDDERAVLVMSRFAGAADELKRGALLVDPTDRNAVADALDAALRMPPMQQRERMVGMRQVVRRANIYRWAGAMLSDAALLREADTRPATAWRDVA